MTTRPTLQQNYIKSAGTIIDTMENIGASPLWHTNTGSGTVSLSTDHFLTGSGAAKVAVSSGAYSIIRTVSWDVKSAPVIEMDVYVDDISHLTNIQLYITLNGTVSFCSMNSQYYGFKTGWNHLIFHPEQFSPTPAWEYAVTSCKIVFTSTIGAVNCWIDAIYAGTQRRAKLLLSFDDAYASQYSVLFPVMEAAGLVGTLWVCPGTIGHDGFMTLAQIQEMYAAGWAVGDHTMNHLVDLHAKPEATIRSEIADCTDYLIVNGMPRAAYHFAYLCHVFCKTGKLGLYSSLPLQKF